MNRSANMPYTFHTSVMTTLRIMVVLSSRVYGKCSCCTFCTFALAAICSTPTPPAPEQATSAKTQVPAIYHTPAPPLPLLLSFLPDANPFPVLPRPLSDLPHCILSFHTLVLHIFLIGPSCLLLVLRLNLLRDVKPVLVVLARGSF